MKDISIQHNRLIIWWLINVTSCSRYSFALTRFFLFTIIGVWGVVFGQTDHSTHPLDIKTYHLHLDFRAMASGQLTGITAINYAVRSRDVQEFELQLMRMTVDSIFVGQQKAEFIRLKDSLITVITPQPLNQGDTGTVRVYYHGAPASDPRGLGGFIFRGGYAFNVGVTIANVPPNFGKAFYPCVDTYTERATYQYYLRVPEGLMAVACGQLVDSLTHPDRSKTYHWKISQPIPTYISGVAVGKFIKIQKNYQSQYTSTIPATFYVMPQVVPFFEQTFKNLQLALTTFEAAYGPYPFERIGYVVLPFFAFAMEHASNVVYPQQIVDGSNDHDDILVHELAHHWFGNLMTMVSANENWIKEGFCRDSEVMFYEQLGLETDQPTLGVDAARKMHALMLNQGAIRDNGHWPVANLPRHAVYGLHAYEKAGSVVYTLRHYLGHAKYTEVIKTLFRNHRFGSWTTAELQDLMRTVSGVDLTAFFRGWLQTPGYAHFAIDSFKVIAQGNNSFTVQLFVHQRLYQKPEFIRQNRIEVLLLGQRYERHLVTLSFDNPIETVTVPFKPVAVFTDPFEKVCDATVDGFHNVFRLGVEEFAETHCSLEVMQVTARDSAIIQVQQNFVLPDLFKRDVRGIRLATRYWSVNGLFPDNFRASATFSYNGNPRTGFDKVWMPKSEDSLLLLYRASTADDWQIQADAILQTGTNKGDGMGSFRVATVRPGQYVIGVRDSNARFFVNRQPALPAAFVPTINLYPNPTDGQFRISCFGFVPQTLAVYNVNGQVVHLQTQPQPDGFINLNHVPAGIYLIAVTDLTGRTLTKSLVRTP